MHAHACTCMQGKGKGDSANQAGCYSSSGCKKVLLIHESLCFQWSQFTSLCSQLGTASVLGRLFTTHDQPGEARLGKCHC